jgi:hypothetical protein
MSEDLPKKLDVCRVKRPEMAEIAGVRLFLCYSGHPGETCALRLSAIEPDRRLPLMALTAPRPLQVKQIRNSREGTHPLGD